MVPNLIEFQKAKGLRVECKAESTTADIIVYGPIGDVFWGDEISAKSFSDELNKLSKSVKEINVRLNSPGGDCFMGIAIYNRLKQHSAKVKVHIDGLAASIASIIMCAADEIIIGEGALVMVHLPWTMAYGNRIDMDKVVGSLMDIEEQMISIYQKRMKSISRSEIRSMLEKETWLDAESSMTMGLVDSKAEGKVKIAASVFDKATWISKRPQIAASLEAETKNKILDLKSKVEGFIARSKK